MYVCVHTCAHTGMQVHMLNMRTHLDLAVALKIVYWIRSNRKYLEDRTDRVGKIGFKCGEVKES